MRRQAYADAGAERMIQTGICRQGLMQANMHGCARTHVSEHGWQPTGAEPQGYERMRRHREDVESVHETGEGWTSLTYIGYERDASERADNQAKASAPDQ